MSKDYVAPEFNKRSFCCPYCHALAHQKRKYMGKFLTTLEIGTRMELYITLCYSCKKEALWIYEEIDGEIRKGAPPYLLYPPSSTAPLANPNMPESVQKFYNEAREIFNNSPRAAAALLRCALEKLTEELGQTKGSLNTRIGNLKKKGLNERVIKSLDIVRITANEGGVHVGQIDLTGSDNAEIVNKLFKLVNIIVEKTITEPQEIDELYSSLPEDKKQGIENRDNKTP